MKRWQRLFFLTLVCHFGLTIATGFIWNGLEAALNSHRTPALLDATYASFYLFVPFCQPVFWPLSDWVEYSGHFNLLRHSAVLQVSELLVIAFINSLAASVILFSLASLVRAAWSRRHKPLAA